jgi:hypothetical protein
MSSASDPETRTRMKAAPSESVPMLTFFQIASTRTMISNARDSVWGMVIRPPGERDVCY